METVISLAQNLTQHFPSKMVGKDDTEFVQSFQFNLTAFLVTILVSLIIAPFVFVLIGLIMFSGEKKDKSSGIGKDKVKKSAIKTVPFISFIWIFIQKRIDVPKTLKEIVKRFGLAFRLNILGLSRNVWINDPVMLKKLDLFTEPVHLHKPSWYHKIIPNLIKNGSTTTSAQREALLQAFNNKNVGSHLKIFEKHSKMIRSAAREESMDKGEIGKRSKRFESQVSKCTFDMFADISFGNEVDLNSKKIFQLFEHFERVRSLAGFCLNHYFILPSFLWALHPVKWYMDGTCRQILKLVNKITENTDKPVRETTIENTIDIPGKSLIEVMSKAGLSKEEISAEVGAFIAWGHVTVSTTLNKLMFHLSDNQEYQHKCQQEIYTMFEQINKSGDTVEITNEALDELKFLDRCIQECLRLYPTFQLFGRNVKTTVQLDKNVTISAGTNVLTSHWLLHRNPENYQNPDTFNPDRFLTENSKNKDIFEYMTCSLGPTNCIWHSLVTQQLKVFASYVLRDLEVYTDRKIETLTDKVLNSSMQTRDVKLRRRQFN